MSVEKMVLEEIIWEDHFSSTDWTSQDEFAKDERIFVTSVGYRLKETRQRVTIIQNMTEGGMVSNTMTILKKNIQKRTVLREGLK